MPKIMRAIGWMFGGANTRLHVAAERGDVAEITTLLGRGADAKARNKDGKRPIDLANDENMAKDAAYWRLHDASF